MLIGRKLARALAGVIAGLTLVASPARAQTNPQALEGRAKGSDSLTKTDDLKSREAGDGLVALRSIGWKTGPTKVDLADQARIQLPEDVLFGGAEAARKVLGLMNNPASGTELAVLTDSRFGWFLFFEFSPIGYVRGGDTEELNAADILSSIREGTKQANDERQRRGWPTVNVMGWHTAPFLDKQTQSLQWCIKAESRGKTVANHAMRMLGRSGVMSARLLARPEQSGESLRRVQAILREGFAFRAGQRYADHVPGDRIAEYGLSWLVVVGAVGVAPKHGFFGRIRLSVVKMWKPLLLGVLVVGLGIGVVFMRRKHMSGF